MEQDTVITNEQVTETPAQNTVMEETQEQVQGQPQVEGQTTEQPVENNNEQQPQQEEQVAEPTAEELKAKLREYEVREEEDRVLREKLGLKDVDQATYNYMNLDQQIVNEGKQVYLRLCNEYGIDANPDKIDASVEALKQSDPAKAYEFQRKFESLGNEVTYRRQAVQQQNTYYEVQKFERDYNDIIQASPALNNVLTQYVQTYNPMQGGDVYGQLKGVVDILMPCYQEAFEAGKRFALGDKAKRDTTPVQGGVAAGGGTNTYVADTTFTREQIRNMSPAEFAKNEVAIKQAMIEGKIQ